MEQNNAKTQTDRILYIDFLKFIGLISIMTAHVGSPAWAIMLRCYDVPLMVILSSILANRSYDKYVISKTPATKYFISRIKRLVFPTWIFLCIYFALFLLFGKEHYDLTFYIDSFCLTRYGIGYVWVILIYLYSALLIPLFQRMGLSIKAVLGLTAVYIAYEIAYFLQLGTDIKLVDTTVYYIIPYGVVTYLGYVYPEMSRKAKRGIMLASGLLFLILAVYYRFTIGAFTSVMIAKYPPRAYFLSYGIACSFIFLYLCENHDLKIYDNALIRFVSTHSLWIYLWHILVLAVYERARLPEIWVFKLVIVFAVSCVIVIVVNKLLDLIERKVNIPIFKYLRG